MGCDIISQEKVKVIFVIGGPGSGKGTQCEKIKELYNWEHISTGEILRKVVEEKRHPKWEEIRDAMMSGQFVSSSDTLNIVCEHFSKLKNKKVLLDGFPINNENLFEWEKKLNDVTEIVGLFYFKCSPNTMMTRVLKNKKSRRSDQEEDIMNSRIDVFERETLPLLDKMKNDYPLYGFDAEATKEQVLEQIKECFDASGRLIVIITKSIYIHPPYINNCN